jgi:hypothetical protein
MIPIWLLYFSIFPVYSHNYPIMFLYTSQQNHMYIYIYIYITHDNPIDNPIMFHINLQYII